PAAARAYEATLHAGGVAVLPGTVEAADFSDPGLAVRTYTISKAPMVGSTVGDIRAKAPRISLELVRRNGEWLTPDAGTQLREGDQVVVVAPIAAHVRVREALGPDLPDAEARALRELHTVDVVVRRREAANRSLKQLLLRLGPGLFPNTVFRAGEPL